MSFVQQSKADARAEQKELNRLEGRLLQDSLADEDVMFKKYVSSIMDTYAATGRTTKPMELELGRTQKFSK